MTQTNRGKVWLVGAGPGDPGLLTLKGAKAIANCDVLVYDYLAAAPIVAMAPPDCEKIYVGKKADKHTMPQDEITQLIVKLGLEGKRVVRLKGGDVFVFARGGEEARELRDAGVPFEIVPGITSAIAAPAYAGIPVTHRNHNTSFTISTGHEDPTKGYSSLDFAKLANPAQTLVFLMAMGSLAGIVAKLREHGMPGDMPVGIVREGTKPTQETLVGTLETIVDDVERTRFAAPAIVVIGKVVNEREHIRWFDTTPLFGKTVLITRPRGSEDEFAEKLYEYGAQPLAVPAIAIAPPEDEHPVSDAVAHVRDYAWIVFTSRNGVEAFFDRLHAAGHDARALGDVKVAAIGPATASRLTALGVRPDFVPATAVGEAVAEGLLERTKPGDQILLFRASDARDVIPETLASAERIVDDVAAYRTVPVNDPALAEAAQAADVWTFASASALRAFAASVPDAVTLGAQRQIACIGPITAEAARDLGLRVDVVASEFSVDGLIDAMREAAVR